MKAETFNKLVADKQAANDLIAALSASSHASAKALISEQEKVLKEIDAKLATSEKQVKLVQALDAKVTEPICASLLKALKSAGVDFNAIVAFRYDYKHDVVLASPPRAARALSKAKGSTWKYNGEALPASVNVNFGNRGAKAKAYALVGTLDVNKVYNTLEALNNDFVDCFKGLSTDYAKTDKYKASSARERFKRMTNGETDLMTYATEVPGETSEHAEKEAEVQTAN